ncbi:hypothetical protein D3C77_516850 [compost metagenome]
MPAVGLHERAQSVCGIFLQWIPLQQNSATEPLRQAVILLRHLGNLIVAQVHDAQFLTSEQIWRELGDVGALQVYALQSQHPGE